MTYVGGQAKEWVVDQGMIRWAYVGFILAVLYAAWFILVLVAEDRGWGDNPGAWAGLPTDFWAIVGLAFYAGLAVFLLALLVRHEVPARTFQVGDDGRLIDAPRGQLRVTQRAPDHEYEHADW